LKPAIATLIFVCSFLLASGIDSLGLKSYDIERIPVAPQIDGHWNDAIWEGIPIATDFVQLRPIENAPPTFRTEIKLAYDDGALYMAAYCYDPQPDSILRQLGNRDDGLNADFIRISIDPYDQQQDNTSFLVYASGVQSEWKASDGSFNAVWESAVQIHEDGWSAEYRIPFSAIRFPKKESQQWTMQIKRHIRRYREDDIWAPIDLDDRNYMNYWGKLKGFKDIDPPVRLSLTPFITVQLKTAPNDDDEREFDWLISGGADLKYGLNESFTLDMTLLPDFSQIQSDDIVNNLSAFETVYDEKRSFFQEGIDLFTKGNLFYSRRIGAPVLDPDAVDDAVVDSLGDKIIKEPEISRLLNAFKISGRSKNGTGIGLFNAIEGRSFAKIEEVDGDIRKIRTSPLSNYNIFVLEKNFDNNRSFYMINTNVVRTDGFDNANVLGTGFDVNLGKDNYNLFSELSFSLINDKEDVGQRSAGFKYKAEFEKIKGRFRFSAETGGITKNYDINDLGVSFRTDNMWHNARLRYNITDPIGRLLQLYNSVTIRFRERMSTGELAGTWLETNTYTTFKKSYLSLWFGTEVALYRAKDYYEARQDDRVFREYKWGGYYLGFSTDYRKRLALDFDTWQAYSREYGGATDFHITFKPIFRVNDHLTLSHRFFFRNFHNDIGYATENDLAEPIFGSRDRRDISNTFTANYIFRNNLSLGLRARQYWSAVDYFQFYDLREDGYLEENDFDDSTDPQNSNFNSFNIDVLFSWEFAPGSSLSVSYKNSIFQSDDEIPDNYWKNMGGLFKEIQSNVISIRAVYYLDYVNIRSKVQQGRERRADRSPEDPVIPINPLN